MDVGWTKVEGIADAGQLTTVYNLEVEDDHTYYFVGGTGWGWAVWAHNTSCDGNPWNLYRQYNAMNQFGVRGLQAIVKAYNWTKRIVITKSGWQHVLDRHVGYILPKFVGRSKFTVSLAELKRV